MTKELIIHDTAEVTVSDPKTGKIVMLGNTTTAGISQSLTEEDIKAGIGNGVIYKMRTDKSIELNVTSATFTSENLAMTQGVEVTQDSLVITKTGSLKVKKDDNSDLVVDFNELKGEHSAAAIALITEALVENEDVAVTSGIAIIPVGSDIAEGDEVTVHYKEEVKGEAVKLDADKFSRKYHVQLRTIGYDLDTAEVGADIYLVFEETIPSGEFELSFGAGEPIAPEIKFQVLKPKGSSTMGTYIEVPR